MRMIEGLRIQLSEVATIEVEAAPSTAGLITLVPIDRELRLHLETVLLMSSLSASRTLQLLHF